MRRSGGFDDGDDIRDLIRHRVSAKSPVTRVNRKAPLMPQLPPPLVTQIDGRANTRSNKPDPPKSGKTSSRGRSRSNDRARHKRMLAREEQNTRENFNPFQENNSDTNSTTDSEQDKGSSRKGFNFPPSNESLALEHLLTLNKDDEIYQRRSREESRASTTRPSSRSASRGRQVVNLIKDRISRSKSRARSSSRAPDEVDKVEKIAKDEKKNAKNEKRERRRTRSKSRGGDEEDGKGKKELRSGRRSSSRKPSKTRSRSKNRERSKSRKRDGRSRSKGRKPASIKSSKLSESEHSETIRKKKRSSSKRRSSSASAQKKAVEKSLASRLADLPGAHNSMSAAASWDIESDTIYSEKRSTTRSPKNLDAIPKDYWHFSPKGWNASPKDWNALDSPGSISSAKSLSRATFKGMKLPPFSRKLKRTNSNNSLKSSETKNSVSSKNMSNNRVAPKSPNPKRKENLVAKTMRRATVIGSAATKVMSPKGISPKPPRRASAQIMQQSLQPPFRNDNPFQKKETTPDSQGREWQTDFTKTMTDSDEESNAVTKFERLWNKDGTLRSEVDDSEGAEYETISTPVPTPTPTPVVSRTESRDSGCQTVPMTDADKAILTKGLENEKFSRYDEQLYESELQIKAITDQVTSLEDELEVKNENFLAVEEKLEASLLENEIQKSEADKALKESKWQITELKSALEDRTTQIETLQRQLDAVYSENNEEMRDAESTLKDLQGKIDAIQVSLDIKEVEVEKLKKKLEMVEQERDNRDGEEREEADVQLADFREQVTALQDALDEKESEVIQLQRKVDEAECENKVLMEELEELLKEKTAAENGVKVGGEADADPQSRIKELENELEDATKVANLQLEELDEQVDQLQDKLKAERMDSAAKIKTRDATIDELTTKLRKYESVPSSSSHSFGFTNHSNGMKASSNHTIDSGGSTEMAMIDVPSETPLICTDDVLDIESAKQKVYEARADATSVRESLEISTKRCAELTLANEHLTQKNSELVDTSRERDELKDRVRDWTAQTYMWKRRAEEAESRLAKLTDTDEDDAIAAQGNMIAAVMEKGIGKKTEEKSAGGWNLWRKGDLKQNSNHKTRAKENTSSSDGDVSAEAKEAQIETLNETIAKLRSEIFQINTAHKEETYLTKKRISELEGENEALTIQNGTLEQLSRFHQDD